MYKKHSAKKNKNAGFTLVELIVVLVILGILASAAVYSIVRYIDMTRYNNNQRTAETIYQSAQSYLNHMAENGTVDEWCRDLIGPAGLNDESGSGIGTEDPSQNNNPELFDTKFNLGSFRLFPNNLPNALPGQSVHMRYAVTYTPGSDDPQSKLIRDLISPDFKATDVMSGIITIEFDVEKVLDASGNLHLSASVCSAFYDSKRTNWDTKVYNGYTDLIVPIRDEAYRRDTSLIGYYCGTVSLSSVDSVFVPSEVEVNDFTLRNGETLEMKWSVKSDDKQITGVPAHVHYTFSLYNADTDVKICDLALNENSIFEGYPQQNLYTARFTDILKFSKDNFDNLLNNHTDNRTFVSHTGSKDYTVLYTKETVSDIRGIPINVYKASIQGVAKVYVHRASSSHYDFSYNAEGAKLFEPDNYFNFPITISYEIYDVYGTTISEGVYYSLTLDAMMSRNLIDNASGPAAGTADVTLKTLNYSFHRLLNPGTTKLRNDEFAANIYATMIAENDDFGSSYANYKGDILPTTDTIYASRALDDPIYYVSEGNYRYMDCAATREINKGYAVVNSYFGDLGTGSVGTKPTIGGTDNAVITSYRHLYNIRMLEGNGSIDVCYSIARDLDWYKVRTEEGRKLYSSDVIVYSAANEVGIMPYSPVPVPGATAYTHKKYGYDLNVVSFPSLPLLNSHSTLKAVKNTLTGNTASINNVQMRLESFFNKNYVANTLDGYGLINTNKGTVINIRANGMTLLLDDLPDGSPDDTDAIKSAVSKLVNTTVEATDDLVFKGMSGSSGSTPMGGLIGSNAGTVGSSSETDKENNTIKFSNCIVTSLYRNASGDWKLYKLSACAGIIGDNGSTTGGTYVGHMYGHFEATGRFVAANWLNVSSVLGYTRNDVNAFIRVNNTEDTDKALIDFGDDITSVLYATCDSLGGAVGSSLNHSNFRQGSDVAVLSYTCTSEGILTLTEDLGLASPVSPDEYAIDVTLDSHSYILCKTDDKSKEIKREAGIGGAVGRINEYGGGALSIRVKNDGVITSSDGTSYVKNLGGAVGVITNGSVSHASIIVVNGATSRIGSYGTYSGYAHTTGGAVGKINNMTGADGNIFISVVNNGVIYGNCTHMGPQLNTNVNLKIGGIGGAVGAFLGSYNKLPVCRIAAYNYGSIDGDLFNVPVTNSICNDSGIGGAVGYIDYMPRASSLYCLESGTVHSSGYNAGGCVGIHKDKLTGDPEATYTTITAQLKNGAEIISDLSNAGGCIGNTLHVCPYIAFRTIVSGNVAIDAMANAGGVCGLYKASTDSANSLMALMQGGTEAAAISIKTSKQTSIGTAFDSDTVNAGGLIGYIMVGSSEIKTRLTLPSQTAGNMVIVNVDSYDNAGGMIGKIENTNHSTTSDMEIVLNPYSHIHARNNNAGGAIGYLNQKMNLNSRISVSSYVYLNTAAPIIQADGGNVGGCIGYATGSMSVNSSLTMASNGGYVKGGNNIGGCIGSLEGSHTISESGEIKLSGSILSLEGTYISSENKLLSSRMGGCIGNCSGTTINGTVKTELNNLALNGYEYIGGCFGRLSGGKLSENGHILFTGTNSLISGKSNVGGCIGKAENNINILGEIAYSGESAHILCSSTDEAPEYAGGIFGSVTGCYFKSNSVVSFASDNSYIAGKDYTGGITGAISSSNIESNSNITFSGENTTISGKDYTGGIFGYVNTKTNIKNNAVISYRASSLIPSDPNEAPKNSSITGSFCTGGLIGCFDSQSTVNDSVKLNFEGSDVAINGTENTGGLFGKVTGGSTGGSVQYNFTGKNISIIGTKCVGGMIGLSDAFINGAKLKFVPVSQCSITGTDYVGGCAGRGLSRIDNNGNIHTKPAIILDGCTLTITGSGYTGGALGSSEANCYYSGASIELNDSTVIIESTGSCAGGNLGYLAGGNIGGSTNLYITLAGNSTFTIKAKTYAGGLIGVIENETKEYGNTPNISIVSNSTSSINVSGGTAAGGLIGYCGNTFGKRNGISSVTIPNGGNINISSPGVWGVLIGVNAGKFASSTNITYYATLSNYPTGEDANNLLFGSVENGTVEKFKYSINGNAGQYTAP